MNFQSKIERMSMPEPNSGCWLWLGTLQSEGYGIVYVGPTDKRYAHRVSFESFNGPVADGMVVRHQCDNPACVNPEHLVLGTHQDNMDDKARRGRQAGAGKGEAHWKATLTSADVLAIRADNRPQKVIAAEYGVRQQAISKIKRREVWQHV